MQTIFTEGMQLKEQLRLILECGAHLFSELCACLLFSLRKFGLFLLFFWERDTKKKKKKHVLTTLPHLLVEFIFLALSLLHP